jgi:protein-S-isoprenylcysteine O-methyltransferase Ste14
VLTAIKAVLFTIVVPGTVALYGPYQVLGRYPSRWAGFESQFRVAGVCFAVLGALIYLWCLWDFAVAGRGTPAPIDPPKELVVRGLYRYSRNPMYVGVLSVILAQALFFRAPAVLVYGAIVFAFFAAMVVLYEEPVLSRKFGGAYARYCAQTPRWFPKLP